ncbi:MAG: hypothetical protein ACRYGK_01915, partial [Janthinobacterium lividum]
LIASYLENRDRATTRAVVIPAALLAVLCAAGLPFLGRIAGMASDAYSLPLYEGYATWVGAAGIVGLVGSLACILLARRFRPQAILVLAATGFISAMLLMLGHDPMGRYAAGIAYVPAVKAELTPSTPLYAVGRYEQALPFYLGRTTTLVEHMDELEFGLRLEPQLWIPTRQEFARIWSADSVAGKKSVAIMAVWIYEEFAKSGLPMRVIAKDPRRVIVTNDPAVVVTPVSANTVNNLVLPVLAQGAGEAIVTAGPAHTGNKK